MIDTAALPCDDSRTRHEFRCSDAKSQVFAFATHLQICNMFRHTDSPIMRIVTSRLMQILELAGNKHRILNTMSSRNRRQGGSVECSTRQTQCNMFTSFSDHILSALPYLTWHDHGRVRAATRNKDSWPRGKLREHETVQQAH